MILTLTPNPCVDKTVFIDRLEPGGRFRSNKCTFVPGGKGSNVSRAAKALGADTAAMVIVGGHTGHHVVEMIEKDDGVRCVPVWVAGITRTITTVLESEVHRQTAFFEPGSPVTPEEAEAVVACFRDAVKGATVATFNGSVPDPSLLDLHRHCVRIARDARVFTILDSYGKEFRRGLAAGPDMVKPNREEAALLLGRSLDSVKDCWEAVDAFHALGAGLVVLSLGAGGALVSQKGERYEVRPPKIKEVNPVGSGDALVAGFAVGIERDMPLSETARLGVAAGTANALSWDIGHFTREEVEAVAAQVQVIPV